jgi:hypothetical protein
MGFCAVRKSSKAVEKGGFEEVKEAEGRHFEHLP